MKKMRRNRMEGLKEKWKRRKREVVKLKTYATLAPRLKLHSS